jgi:hypothetical protein
MKPTKQILLTSLACALALASPSRAEEGGSAHYLPGSTATFMDAFPGTPGGVAVLNYFTYYRANAPTSRSLPLGGNLTLDIKANVYADTFAAIYQPKVEVLGGGLALGVAVPYVWMEVKGQAQRIGPGGALGPVYTARDTANGVGDLNLFPFMLGWTNIARDFKLDTRLGIYAPTGGYEKGRLANVGKNYWTFEPGIMASWLSSKLGTELSLYSGLDFNTRNGATDYQTGTSLHLDAAVAQHLPLLGGFVGVGANAFYYQQITGDSGSGAVLGDFKGKTGGVGPVLSYVRPIGGKSQLLAEVKWLPEFNVDHRMKGDYIWFKLGFTF